MGGAFLTVQSIYGLPHAGQNGRQARQQLSYLHWCSGSRPDTLEPQTVAVEDENQRKAHETRQHWRLLHSESPPAVTATWDLERAAVQPTGRRPAPPHSMVTASRNNNQLESGVMNKWSIPRRPCFPCFSLFS